jgi:hypothetical protein
MTTDRADKDPPTDQNPILPPDLQARNEALIKKERGRKKHAAGKTATEGETTKNGGTKRGGDGKTGRPDRRKTLPFFQIPATGKLYLTVRTGDIFQFIHEEEGALVEEEFIKDITPIYPCTLPIHQDTGELVLIVGVPDGDIMKAVPVLSAVDLYKMMRKHIWKYADLPELELQMGIYYALYTWFYLKVPTSPYLRYLGDTGKGKTRLLDVVSDLCFYPIRVVGASSTSGIMRFHERWKGTLVIDEGDLKGGAEDPLIKFLNCGFEQGKFLILSDKNDPNQQQIFDPFGPKVLAMRAPFKDNATEGRCISYTPYETARKDIPPELPKGYHIQTANIRAHIARFVLHRWQDLDGDKLFDLTTLDIERRLLQMSRPISIILQLFPDGTKRFISYIMQRQKEIRKTRAESWEGSLFNYALSLALGDEVDADDRPYTLVTAKIIADVFKTSPKNVTSSLRTIGFDVEVDNIGIGPKRKSIRKLVVPSEKVWWEIIRRYYSPPDENVQAQIGDLDPRGPSCPDVLRSSRFVTDVTHVTVPANTLHTHFNDRCVFAQSVTSVPCVTPAYQDDIQGTGQNIINNSRFCESSNGPDVAHPPHIPQPQPPYAGKTRAELIEILRQYHPGKPPNPEEFSAAWKATGPPQDLPGAAGDEEMTRSNLHV